MTQPRPRIVVSAQIPEPAMRICRTAGDVRAPETERGWSSRELHETLPGTDAALTVVGDRVDAAFADAAGPQLQVVANIAVGYDNIDVAEMTARGITVTNTPGVLTDATADLTFGLLLNVTRRLGEGERLLRSKTPWTFHLGFMLGTGLQGKTLGIIGLGQIGRAVARRARAFGMEIVYTGRRRAPEEVEHELAARYLTFEDLLRTSDVVSLHCPLTTETHHLIDAAALAMMQPTAYLLNTTRGAVVDEPALAEALDAGVIAGAGLDVFENEPEVHPRLLGLDNVALAPHLGSATAETRTAMATLAAENVASVLSGSDPITPVKG